MKYKGVKVKGIFINHLKKQSWVVKISITLLWSWLIVTIPLLLILLFIIVSTKEPTFLFIILSIILFILSYTLLPALLINFYRSKSVEVTLKLNENNFNYIRKFPIPIWSNVSILCTN